MISLVAQSINWCVNSVLFVLSAAAYIGQTIVIVLACLLNGFAVLCEFIQTVYEDNTNFFTMEVPSMVMDSPGLVISRFVEAAEFISNLIFAVYKVISEPLFGFLSFVIQSVNMSVESFKKFLIIIGDSVWLIVTFIPMELPGITSAALSWIVGSCVKAITNIYSSLLRLTNHLTDVPLQSTVGIVAVVVIVRLIVDFQIEILSFLARSYWWMISRLRLYYHTVYNYFTDDEMRTIDEIFRDRRARPMSAELLREMAGEGREGERGEALCVVCQERQKCVLILPCRHICLCCECCVRLYNYQRTCPICRTFICHSVNVYY